MLKMILFFLRTACRCHRLLLAAKVGQIQIDTYANLIEMDFNQTLSKRSFASKC